MLKEKIYNEILYFFPNDILNFFENIQEKEWNKATEIRIRVGRPIIIQFFDNEKILLKIITAEDILKLVSNFSENSMYMIQSDINKGFITIKGGHRIGISGTCICERKGDFFDVKNIKYISSLNIRIAREVKSCSDFILDVIVEKVRATTEHINEKIGNFVIISPPGCGKTTILRDLIRNLSDGYKCVSPKKIGIVDERGEIAASYMGETQNDVGIRTDVMNECEKSIGMNMMIRSMGLDFIATDEIGTRDDECAIYDAIKSGVKLLVTCHGEDIDDIPQNFLENKIFDYIIVLKKGKSPGTVNKIYFKNGEDYNVVF